MRDVARRSRHCADVSEILFGGDALYPVRYRSGLSLSVGGGLQTDAGERCGPYLWLDGLLPGDPLRRLHLRAEKRSFRLEVLIGDSSSVLGNRYVRITLRSPIINHLLISL